MGIMANRDMRPVGSLVKPGFSTRSAPDLSGLLGIGQGFLSIGGCRVPILAHPELAGPLFEAVAEALVLEGPIAARITDFQVFIAFFRHGLKLYYKVNLELPAC
jgi:hypothetical protein